MKILISILFIALPSIALSQSSHLEIKQAFLSDSANIGAWEISTHKSMLDKSLSASLKSEILQSSEPYSIANMGEILTLVDKERSKIYPDLKLSIHTFEGSKALNISISRIDTKYGRDILRGEVDGFTGSQVKLVMYEGKMTGRITFSNSQKVIVIRSIDGGISANYEVNTSNITYD